jgi:hypothetical protein
MKVKIRQALDNDEDTFVDFAVRLSKLNLTNHERICGIL